MSFLRKQESSFIPVYSRTTGKLGEFSFLDSRFRGNDNESPSAAGETSYMIRLPGYQSRKRHYSKRCAF